MQSVKRHYNIGMKQYWSEYRTRTRINASLRHKLIMMKLWLKTAVNCSIQSVTCYGMQLGVREHYWHVLTRNSKDTYFVQPGNALSQNVQLKNPDTPWSSSFLWRCTMKSSPLKCSPNSENCWSAKTSETDVLRPKAPMQNYCLQCLHLVLFLSTTD